MNLLMNPVELWFGFIKEWMTKLNPPPDYFDFPASATAFCFSLPKSLPMILDNCLFRQYGKTYKLISFQGPSIAIDSIQRLINQGRRVKSVPFAFRLPSENVHAKYGKYEYYASLPYIFKDRIAFHSHDNRARLRRDYRRGEERYELTRDVKKEEVDDLLEEWLKDAKPRHFMVRKGHHKAYVNMYFSGIGNIQLIGFRRRSDGLLYGVMGFEVIDINFEDQAQMTLGKHRLGDNVFSTFYYVKTLELISEMGVKRVLCGSSGDVFKQRIGLERRRSWKPTLIIKDDEEEDETG